MSTCLASVVDSLTEGRWVVGDPVKKSDQLLTCSSIEQREARGRDRSQSPNPT
jgi:hypothetical protein